MSIETGRSWRFAGLLGAATLVASCGGPATGTAGATSAATPRLEAFCQLEGLPQSARQSVLVIDERVLVKATEPADARVVNPELFAIALSLGDPMQAVSSGAMAPRERLSVYIAPATGTAPRLVFTGCVPGVSADEMKALTARKSKVRGAVDSYFGANVGNKVSEATTEFRQALLGSLVRAVKDPAAGRKAADLQSSSIIRSLASVRQLAAPEQGLPRLFVLTDLTLFTAAGVVQPADARRAGFAAADTARLAFGKAEVHLLGRKAGTTLGRDFADAFVLGSQGLLQSWGGTTFSNAPAPPVKVRLFAGKIDYGGMEYPAQLRLAVDRNGSLVNSWLVVKLDREYATPVTGALACTPEDSCRLTSDDKGLAQAWSLDPNPQPEFAADMPLGGLRYIEADIVDGVATGKVFDPSVDQIGSLPGSLGLRFRMTVAS